MMSPNSLVQESLTELNYHGYLESHDMRYRSKTGKIISVSPNLVILDGSYQEESGKVISQTHGIFLGYKSIDSENHFISLAENPNKHYALDSIEKTGDHDFPRYIKVNFFLIPHSTENFIGLSETPKNITINAAAIVLLDEVNRKIEHLEKNKHIDWTYKEGPNRTDFYSSVSNVFRKLGMKRKLFRLRADINPKTLEVANDSFDLLTDSATDEEIKKFLQYAEPFASRVGYRIRVIQE